MNIAIIGAAGVRTPLILQSIIARQERLGIHELRLMDIDAERLELVSALTRSINEDHEIKFNIIYTTDPILALKDADYVITTFRVGGIESRVIDERVPLSYGVLGQETTGPGGFAMGIRSIPVFLNYVKLMQTNCPGAWLINFANPAGMLTEAAIRHTGWNRVVGICDSPASMHRVIASLLKANPDDVYMDYFGLNHLGWIKRIVLHGKDHLPDLIERMHEVKQIPGLPFDTDLVASLGLIPNEYLYYYYYSSKSINNILSTKECRGEQVSRLNLSLFKELRRKYITRDLAGMKTTYLEYLNLRSESYMVAETGKTHDLSMIEPDVQKSLADEGYAGVALDLIEALNGRKPTVQVLNIANRSAIPEMGGLDVVEIPALVSHDHIQPLVVGEIPSHCLGLMKQVKQYEQLTIAASVESSYQKALLALTIHPLVKDFTVARSILNDYISQHKDYFPKMA